MQQDVAPARRSFVSDWKPVLVAAGVFVAWFALNRWVLPKLGVST